MISGRCNLSSTVFIFDFTGHLINEHDALSGMNSGTVINVTLQRKRDSRTNITPVSIRAPTIVVPPAQAL
ncbi:hypothetical protein DPMN_106231 [Dreissena polymorpha]|uniref:Uncharacterized protein n=1 Tax=Dreissena polymorpha TaxID=45954 RepID=A0A9D4QJI8_DREPO|nr:hypothetical protein DPMN_106231 [Dreissena polymorpha]